MNVQISLINMSNIISNKIVQHNKKVQSLLAVFFPHTALLLLVADISILGYSLGHGHRLLSLDISIISIIVIVNVTCICDTTTVFFILAVSATLT